MTGAPVRVVRRQDLVAARRERRRAVEEGYRAPTSATVVVRSSRLRGVVLGLFGSVVLWAAEPWAAHVWPAIRRAVVPGG